MLPGRLTGEDGEELPLDDTPMESVDGWRISSHFEPRAFEKWSSTLPATERAVAESGGQYCNPKLRRKCSSTTGSQVCGELDASGLWVSRRGQLLVGLVDGLFQLETQVMTDGRICCSMEAGTGLGVLLTVGTGLGVFLMVGPGLGVWLPAGTGLGVWLSAGMQLLRGFLINAKGSSKGGLGSEDVQWYLC